MENNKDKIFSGFMIDPLISNSPRECDEMFEEIWAALKQLPNRKDLETGADSRVAV